MSWKKLNNEIKYKTATLGEGGNSFVHKGLKIASQEEIAVKILKRTNNFKKKLQRFKDEITIVKDEQEKISGILPIYDFYLEGPKYWYTMPLATPIRKYLAKKSLIDKVDCIIEISRSLQQLHHKKIFHRDIKPSNMYFYKDHYVLGDFGLVDYPDKKDITKTKECIGNKETIAPEMLGDMPHADLDLGKADVYSLAKTLWMLITENEYCFKGMYNRDNNIVNIQVKFPKEHTVELEDLLVESTQDNPDDRPNIGEFLEKLSNFKKVYSDNMLVALSEWNFIQKQIFNYVRPEITVFSKLTDILKILKIISTMPNINHIFFPDGGGGDIQDVTKAAEEDCLILTIDETDYIIKPKELYINNFYEDTNDAIWTYFFLETGDLKAKFMENIIKEELTEDTPGHYICDKNRIYGYYDDGRELPPNSHDIIRYTKGKFVIFSKLASVYNHISSTYDGRHNLMTAQEFRDYIDRLKQLFQILPAKLFWKICNQLSYPHKITQSLTSKKESPKINKINGFDFFLKEYQKWNLKDFIPNTQQDDDLFCKFFIEVCSSSTSFSSKEDDSFLYLNINKKFEKKQNVYPYIISPAQNCYYFYKREDAEIFIKNIKTYLLKKYNNEIDFQDVNFRIILYKIKNPEHIPTKQELKDILLSGNDNLNNTVVLDADGYIRLISQQVNMSYPVRLETYCAKNNYVGKYSTLSHLNDAYVSLLYGLLEYMKTGLSIYIDYPISHTEGYLLKQIQLQMK